MEDAMASNSSFSKTTEAVHLKPLPLFKGYFDSTIEDMCILRCCFCDYFPLSFLFACNARKVYDEKMIAIYVQNACTWVKLIAFIKNT
jgi:hypothetical protein